MANFEAHVALACKNQQVIELLAEYGKSHFDWIVVVAFYKAVHVVEAVFKEISNEDSPDHRDRNQQLRLHYPTLWRFYKPLWNTSLVARYLSLGDGSQDYNSFSEYKNENQVKNLISFDLKKLEEEAVSLIKKPVQFSWDKPAPPA